MENNQTIKNQYKMETKKNKSKS